MSALTFDGVTGPIKKSLKNLNGSLKDTRAIARLTFLALKHGENAVEEFRTALQINSKVEHLPEQLMCYLLDFAASKSDITALMITCNTRADEIATKRSLGVAEGHSVELYELASLGKRIEMTNEYVGQIDTVYNIMHDECVERFMNLAQGKLEHKTLPNIVSNMQNSRESRHRARRIKYSREDRVAHNLGVLCKFGAQCRNSDNCGFKHDALASAASPVFVNVARPPRTMVPLNASLLSKSSGE